MIILSFLLAHFFAVLTFQTRYLEVLHNGDWSTRFCWPFFRHLLLYLFALTAASLLSYNRSPGADALTLFKIAGLFFLFHILIDLASLFLKHKIKSPPHQFTLFRVFW